MEKGFNIDRFISQQVDLEPEFQKVLDDNLWDLLEGTSTTSSPQPECALEKFTQVMQDVQALLLKTPRFMTETEFYAVHGRGSAVVVPKSLISDFASAFGVASPTYIAFSEFLEDDNCIIISQNGNSSEGFIIK